MAAGGHCILQTYVTKTGLTSGLFMDDFSIVQAGRRRREDKGDVTWNARGATRAQGPLRPVEATHRKNKK